MYVPAYVFFGQLLKLFLFSTDLAIIATRGKTDETIFEAIEAGTNAISYAPQSTGELFKSAIERCRNE